MRNRSLQAEILERLDEAPEARCLGFHGAHEPLRWLTREEVRWRAAAAASHLKHNGLRPGDVCVIVMPSGETAAIVLTASLFLGAVPLLIAPPTLVGGSGQVYETLRRTLRRTRARLAVCATFLQPDLARLTRSVPATRLLFVPGRWYEAAGEQERIAPVLPRMTDVAALQLTSGTTAAPRICVWDHQAVLAALDCMTLAMALSSGDVCVNWTPLYHDMGLVNNFLLCLARGVPLTLLSPQDFVRRPALWLRSLSETGATLTWSPNFGYALATQRAEEGELQGVRLDHVRAFWNAAERIHQHTLDAFYRRFAALGVRREALKTNYGCAENVGGATFSALDAPARHERVDRRLLDERGVARLVAEGHDGFKSVSIVSAGRPHPGLTVRIVSAKGRALPDGCVGEVCLATPSRMLGYYDNARETVRARRGGVLHTGDLGYLRDGELFWVGRIRERITVQGKKLDPSAFEAVLASTPGVREGCFVAFGVPTEQLGTERVIVVSEVRVVLAEELRALTAAIRRGCFLHLGITPHDVVLVRAGTLAKTSSGKRRHNHFRRLYLAGGLEQVRLIGGSNTASPEREHSPFDDGITQGARSKSGRTSPSSSTGPCS